MKPGLAPGLTNTHSEVPQTAAAIVELNGGPGVLLIGDLAGAMERAARLWLTEFCEEDEQSVGTVVNIERPEPFPSAAMITATATLTEIDGRRYSFTVVAVNEHGETIATGAHERRIILRRRFAGGPEAPGAQSLFTISGPDPAGPSGADPVDQGVSLVRGGSDVELHGAARFTGQVAGDVLAAPGEDVRAAGLGTVRQPL